MTRALIILALLLALLTGLVGCAAEPKLPPDQSWEVRMWDGEKRVMRTIRWRPYYRQLFIENRRASKPAATAVEKGLNHE